MLDLSSHNAEGFRPIKLRNAYLGHHFLFDLRCSGPVTVRLWNAHALST